MLLLLLLRLRHRGQWLRDIRIRARGYLGVSVARIRRLHGLGTWLGGRRRWVEVPWLRDQGDRLLPGVHLGGLVRTAIRLRLAVCPGLKI